MFRFLRMIYLKECSSAVDSTKARDDKDCMTPTHSLFDPQHLAQGLAHRYLLNMHVCTYEHMYVCIPDTSNMP